MAKNIFTGFIYIMQIRNTIGNYYNPAFKHWYSTYERNLDNGFMNDTFTYRDEAWWRRFGTFVNEFFKDSTKVNVYNWACSDGEETATFIMQMFSNFPDAAEKFTPVYAKDYDPVAIEMAKKYVLPLDIEEIYKVNYFTNNNLDEFLTNIPDDCKRLIKMSWLEFNKHVFRCQELKENVYQAKLNEKYAQHIDYKVSDIFEDYNKINPKESLVIIRNLLYGLNKIHLNSLLENLSNQMQEKSVLAVGKNDCDELRSLPQLIESFGFKCSNVWGVYYKP